MVEFDTETKTENKILLENASDHVEGYASFVTENPYREEIDAFFRQIENPDTVPLWDFSRDLNLLKIIDGIEA